MNTLPTQQIPTIKAPKNQMYKAKLSTGFRKAWALMALAVTVATVALVAGAQVSIPKIQLSSDPLYAASGGDKPTLALALSVEFPTVGAQYVAGPGSSTDGTYGNTKEYLGYYDSESCYNYNDKPTESPATGLTATDYKRFDIISKATNRMCSNSFSGNFLNWASNSAIDMLRLALSGGDRYIDTAAITVLQRAVLPNGDPICMWNNGNFPAKQLIKDGGGAGKYWGAVPISMINEANGNDLWVANTLNRVYFGTSNTGSCGDTAAYKIGSGATSANQTGPVVNPFSNRRNGLLDFGGSSCAGEGGVCSFTGTKEVLYGAKGTSNSNGGWITFPATNGLNCTSSMTGSTIDPASGTAKKCYIRDYTGPWKPQPSTSALNSDGFFYARVQVCNTSAAGVLVDDRDYKLCTRYPNGTYKPTGSIQKYSDQLRLAAFGYVTDQTASYDNGRYGGVLRAPMKFVGAKTFDINGQENTPITGNPNAEWDTGTGIFASNPDNDSTQTIPISGVINYLNKFGRTGPVPGRYKTYDPIGELHYEVLRYLQGLQPSTAAVSGLTDPKNDFYDGFPLKTVWQDPYGDGRNPSGDYSCLKSNIVVIGDKNTHDGGRLPSASTASNIPDINYWRGIAQNFEKGQVASYTDGQGAAQKTGNPNIANPNVASDSTASQIIGSAYWAHTHDIRPNDPSWTSSAMLMRPGLRTKTFIFDVNENADANDASYRRNEDQLFTAAKYGGFETDDRNTGAKPYNAFGNPFKKQDGSNDNDVWQDPKNPGEASSYYLQSNARGVLAAFDNIFEKSSNSARSIAGSSVANKNLTSGGTLVYQASFDSATWTGDVLAFPIAVASGSANVGKTETWKASTKLDALASPATTRNIVVGRVDQSLTPAASNFAWATIDKSLQDNLAKITPTSAPDSSAQDRLNYLRGDKTLSQFRSRKSLLGDIVNSGVVYSGAPVAPLRATPGFAAFRNQYASRKPAVFAGSNDGMLHAFDAATGDELFGYIPSSMGPKLAALTAQNYNNNHQLYVDATPTVAEAKVGANDTAEDWKTVLVSGMGGGATGVFALNVSDPSNFNENNAMWEFTRSHDKDMGFVVGTPRIITLRTNAKTATTPTFQSFVAVASGVNNYVAENGVSGGNGNPVLFLLALNKKPPELWRESVNYYKITLPVDTMLSAKNPTGLINFKPALGFNGATEQIYMGDLHGNLWKLNFTSGDIKSPADWTMEKLSSFNRGDATGSLPYPLYIAKTAAGSVQPITMAPLLAAGPIDAGVSTTIVGIGTGKYLESGDKTSTLQQSFYAVYDNGSSTSDGGGAINGAISSRNRLQQGTANATTLSVAVGAFRFGRATTDTPAGTPPLRSGWYFDFPVSGERMIINGSILGDKFLLSSLIPASAGAVGSCTAAGGGGNSYELNIDTGNGSLEKSTVGLLGETLLVKVSEVNQTSDSTGKGIKTTSYQKIRIGSTGSTIAPTGLVDKALNRRLTWRQINNYQDLRLGK